MVHIPFSRDFMNDQEPLFGDTLYRALILLIIGTFSATISIMAAIATQSNGTLFEECYTVENCANAAPPH